MEKLNSESYTEIIDFLIINEDIKEIFQAFLSYLPLNESEYELIIDTKKKEIVELISKYKENKKCIKFIFEKMKVLIYQCPFKKVITEFEDLYLKYNNSKKLEESRVSKFYKMDEIPSLKKIADFLENNKMESPFLTTSGTLPENFSGLLIDVFNFNNGRIPHIERLLCWYPDLLQKNYETKICLMFSSGPLPLDWRYFIAIMAISCYGCTYYFYRLSQHFLALGGDKDWLIKGLEAVPNKLRNLQNLNSILAYKPWSLYKSNLIQDLLKGNDQWSIPELLHAIIIMSYYHSWSCFVFANGVKLEYDMGFICYNNINEETKDYQKRDSVELNDRISPVKHSESKNDDILDILKKIEMEKSSEIESNEETFIMKMSENCNEDIISEDFLKETQMDDSTDYEIAFSKYISKEILFNEQFTTHNSRILHSQDFSFDIHGFTLLNEFLPEIGNKLHEELLSLFKMTKRTFGETKNVNTDPLRISIWYYTHNIFGYYHDHFDYKNVKIILKNLILKIHLLMTKQLKQFIRKIVLKPYEMNYQTFSNLQIKLTPVEKCHITLLTIASKFEAELIYGIECLNNLLTNRK